MYFQLLPVGFRVLEVTGRLRVTREPAGQRRTTGDTIRGCEDTMRQDERQMWRLCVLYVFLSFALGPRPAAGLWIAHGTKVVRPRVAMDQQNGTGQPGTQCESVVAVQALQEWRRRLYTVLYVFFNVKTVIIALKTARYKFISRTMVVGVHPTTWVTSTHSIKFTRSVRPTLVAPGSAT